MNRKICECLVVEISLFSDFFWKMRRSWGVRGEEQNLTSSFAFPRGQEKKRGIKLCKVQGTGLCSGRSFQNVQRQRHSMGPGDGCIAHLGRSTLASLRERKAHPGDRPPSQPGVYGAQQKTPRGGCACSRLVEALVVAGVPLLEPFFGVPVLGLDLDKQGIDLGERLRRLQILAGLFVAQLAVVLHLLARGLHFGDSERSGGAFKEVAERRELEKLLVRAGPAKDGEVRGSGRLTVLCPCRRTSWSPGRSRRRPSPWKSHECRHRRARGSG
jgi:hypothetical protein